MQTTLLTSYCSGATHGKRMGTPGYSYDFVAAVFAPLFERLGPTVRVQNQGQLHQEIAAAQTDNSQPVHVSFRPFQDAYLAPGVQNVVVPAWEFPDIPDHEFDANPQNDWVATANRCAMVIVGGPFTADALERAGVNVPVKIVPVPTAASYFDVPCWERDHRTTLICPTFLFPDTPDSIIPFPAEVSGTCRSRSVRRTVRNSAYLMARGAYRTLVKPLIPRGVRPLIAGAVAGGIMAWREQLSEKVRYNSLLATCSDVLDLSGVVYTSIFNPVDGRKNWLDTVTAFLHAMRDREDATLVLKMATSDPAAIDEVVAAYRRLDVSHRCNLVVIAGFLSEAEMLELARVTTYYITSTRAEGNCLPVMNYLAAGRPCISPMHTAIADYFTPEMGFVVQSHPEPAAWPQDSRFRWRTNWHRIVWPSLVESICDSYEIAKRDRRTYAAMAAAGREAMLNWCHPDAVWPRLESAMLALAGQSDDIAVSAEARSQVAA